MSGGWATLGALALSLLLAPWGGPQAARPVPVPAPLPSPIAGTPAVVCRCECSTPEPGPDPGCWGNAAVTVAVGCGLLAGLGLGALGAIWGHSLPPRCTTPGKEASSASGPVVRGLQPLRA